MRDRVTVQIVDDHFLFASSLASVIKELDRYELIGISVTGPQALAMVREEKPDIVLLDYHLPGYSADMLIPRFHAASPETRVIVLTSDTSDEAMVSALRAGAIGFMTKDKAIDDVLEALGTAAEGGRLLTLRQVELVGREVPPPPAAAEPPLPTPDPVELRLIGISSFAHAVLMERSIERLAQVDQVYIRDVSGDRASLRVALRAGASTDGLARELVESSQRVRVRGVEAGVLELQVGGPQSDG